MGIELRKIVFYTSDEAEKLYLHSSSDTCGDGCNAFPQKT